MRKLTTTIQRPCWNMLKLPELSWSSFTPGLHNDGDRRWTCRCLLELTSRRPQLIDSLRSFHLIGHRLRIFADKLCTIFGMQSRPFSLLPKATNTPGDSWRNIFLEDFIKFLCETSPWYAYCNPLPNIAAPEGNECGQRPLPACMASREWMSVATDWHLFCSSDQRLIFKTEANLWQSNANKRTNTHWAERCFERVANLVATKTKTWKRGLTFFHSSIICFCEESLVQCATRASTSLGGSSMREPAPCQAHAATSEHDNIRCVNCRLPDFNQRTTQQPRHQLSL